MQVACEPHWENTGIERTGQNLGSHRVFLGRTCLAHSQKKGLWLTVNEGGLIVFLRKERGSGRRLQSRREWKEADAFSVLLLAAEPTAPLPGCAEKQSTRYYLL